MKDTQCWRREQQFWQPIFLHRTGEKFSGFGSILRSGAEREASSEGAIPQILFTGKRGGGRKIEEKKWCRWRRWREREGEKKMDMKKRNNLEQVFFASSHIAATVNAVSSIYLSIYRRWSLTHSPVLFRVVVEQQQPHPSWCCWMSTTRIRGQAGMKRGKKQVA